MKRTIITALLTLACSSAFAQSATTNSGAEANGIGTANNTGVNTSVGLNSFGSDRVATTPGLSSSSYGVSMSNKNCNSTVGGSGVSTGAGLSISGPTVNEVCEALLIFDSLQSAAATMHNMGVNAKNEESGKVMQAEAARVRNAAMDVMCRTSIETYKMLNSHGLCSPIVSLLFAAGSTDPEQRGQSTP